VVAARPSPQPWLERLDPKVPGDLLLQGRVGAHD
jgi:hypothetical protein